MSPFLALFITLVLALAEIRALDLPPTAAGSKAA